MSKSANSAQRLLAKIRMASVDKVPPGHHPKEWWAKKWNLSLSKTGEYLKTAINAKPPIMHAVRLRGLDATGRTNTLTVYGEVPPKLKTPKKR